MRCGVLRNIELFVEECCIVEAREKVLCRELYEAWKTWCVKNNCHHDVHYIAVFGRYLRHVVPGLCIAQFREFNQKRSYVGIGLKGRKNL